MMKKRVTLLAVVPLLAALSFGVTHPHAVKAHKHARIASGQNRFHFAPTKGRGLAMMSRREEHAPVMSKTRAVRPQAQRPGRKTGQPLPPVSQIGFVAAAQIPGGGYLGHETLQGDFNGDGIADFVTIAGDPTSPGSFSFSVVLSNGDGTFQAPVLTPISSGPDPFAVADVDGDGIDDVIFVHQAGTNGSANSTFDVMLGNGDGSFTQGNNYVITSGLLSGGSAVDFDGDGKVDLVAVDSGNPANVWIVSGNGDGTFSTTPTSISLGGSAGYQVELADLNGDGLLDVTGNDNSTGQQMVYLATSLTAFATVAEYSTSDGVQDAYSTTVADLNGDGKPEILNANSTDNTITIYLNNGDGTYQAGVYYNAATNPTTSSFAYVDPVAVAVGDVNGDGFPDVMVTNNDSGDVTVLLGNGDGTVGSASVGFAVGGYPSRPAMIGDWNGDGLMDIVVPDDNYSLVYMKGYGDGSFRAAVNYYTPVSDNGEAESFDIATGDLNGDGIADVVVGNCCDASMGITVFLARADGSLQPGVNYGSGGGMKYVAVADLDGDGKLDIAASDNVSGMVQIFLGVGDGTFTTGGAYPTDVTNTTPSAIVAADFNGDGKIDLAVSNATGNNVGVMLNDGTGGFSGLANYTVCGSGSQLTAADLNGDGSVDLIVPVASCAEVDFLLNAADGTGNFSAGTPLSTGNNPYQVAVGDMNGDGKMDLVISMDDYANGQGLAVAVGNGDGTFQAPNIPAYPTSLQPTYYEPLPTYVKLVDLDGDGHLDAVYTNSNYGTVGVMYGVGDGTLYDPVEYPTAQLAYGLAVGDINGDGAPDVVTAGSFTAGGGPGSYSSEVTTLINNSGTGAAPDYSVASAPTSVTVTAGQTGTYTITLTPRNFYNGTVTFTCGTLPSKVSCAFSSPTLIPNGNGMLTTTLSLTTTATVTTKLFDLNRGATSLVATLMGFGLFGLVLTGSKGKRVGVIMTVVAVLMILTLVGCGGGSSGGGQNHQTIPGTPAGTYPIAVTATGTAGTNGGNTAAHNLQVTLVVE